MNILHTQPGSPPLRKLLRKRSQAHRGARSVIVGLLVAMVAASGLVPAVSAAAAAGPNMVSIAPSIPAVSPATRTVPEAFVYSLSYTCQACTNAKITIPLGNAAGLQFENNGGYPFTIANGIGTLELGDVDSSNIIDFVVSAPPGSTPDGVTWTFTPQLSADGLAPVTSDASVTGTFRAPFELTATKSAPSGTKIVGSEFTYSIGVQCGLRWADQITITDPLPFGLEFVSATLGGTYSGGTVTWNLHGSDIGGTCGLGSATVPTVTVRVTDAALAGQPEASVENVATVLGTSMDGNTQTVTASTGVGLAAPGTYPNGQFSKQAATAGTNGYVFAGETVEYQLKVNQPRDGYSASIVDPFPCQDSFDGSVYSSATNGVCQNPAFDLERVTILGSTSDVDAAWQPSVRLTDGTTVALSSIGNGSFAVPAALVGRVAELLIPSFAIPDVAGYRTFSLSGKIADDVTGGTTLRNIASAKITNPLGATHNAESSALYKIGTGAILGATKSLSPTDPFDFSAGYDVIAGASLSSNAAIDKPIVITDLLPSGHRVDTSTEMRVVMHSRGAWHTLAAVPEVFDAFQGTGRQLVRVIIEPDLLNDVADLNAEPISYEPSLRFHAIGDAPGEFTNTSQAFYDDGSVDRGCSNRSSIFDDGLDLDGNPSTSTGCQTTATTMMYELDNPSGFQLTKEVKGDLDGEFVAAPGSGSVSAVDGSATYRLNFRNVRSFNIEKPVIYDILPETGDTGLTSLSPRGSQFGVSFVEMGALPSGVTVKYSASANPCRPEVLVNNPGCVDDWSDVPGPTVRALRFASSETYHPATGFALTFNVVVPQAGKGQTAWNSFGGSAQRDNDRLLPYETQNVGITPVVASEGLSMAKAVDKTTAVPGDVVTYSITVTNPNAHEVRAQVTDLFPSNLTITSISDDGEFEAFDGFPGASGVINWPAPMTVPAGSSYALTIEAMVESSAVGTTVTNLAIGGDEEGKQIASTTACSPELFPDLNEAQPSCAQTVVVAAEPAVEVVKDVCTAGVPAECDPAVSANWASEATVRPGGDAVWRVTVKNTGNVMLRDTEVWDTLPDALGAPVGIAVSDGELPDESLRWRLDELAPGSSQTLTFSTRVPEMPGTIVNIADASAAALDGSTIEANETSARIIVQDTGSGPNEPNPPVTPGQPNLPAHPGEPNPPVLDVLTAGLAHTGSGRISPLPLISLLVVGAGLMLIQWRRGRRVAFDQ